MRHFACEANLNPFSWRAVAAAFWRRYPNRFSKHVLSEDVVLRDFDEKGRLRTVRVLTKTNRLPKWGERFAGGHREVIVVEESIVDAQNSTMVTYTRNIGFTSRRIMSVEERCVYSPLANSLANIDALQNATGQKSEAKGHQTNVHREAWIVSPLGGISGSLLEKFGYNRFKTNASSALKGYIEVLHILYPQIQSVDQILSWRYANKLFSHTNFALWKQNIVARCKKCVQIGAINVCRNMPSLNRD